MASVYRRKVRGRKQTTWTVAYFDRHGVRRTKSTKVKKKNLAQAMADRLEADYNNLRLFPGMAPEVDRSEAQATLIADAKVKYLHHLREQGRSEKHVRSTGLAIDQAAALAGISAVRQITPPALDRIKQRLIAGNRSNRTANAYIQAIKALQKFMLEGGSARLPEMAKRQRRAFTPDELQRLLVVPEAIESGRAFRYLMHARSGLRFSESGKLTWDMIDLTEGAERFVLPVSLTKNKRKAIVPIASDLAEQLLQRRPMAITPGGARVFPTRIALKTLLRDVERAGIERVSEAGQLDLHSLRDTFDTFLLRSGCKPLIAQWLMRHTGSMDGVSSLTTERYPDKSQFFKDMQQALAVMVSWCTKQTAEKAEEKTA